MATNEELLATIDAKLSALLKLAAEDQSRPAPNGPVVPTDLAAHAASLETLLRTQSPLPPSPIPSQPMAPPAPAPDDDLARTLNEIACLLGLG